MLSGIGAGGEVDAHTALQAFALAFGPVPGVLVPSGPKGRVLEGGGPLRWVLQHRDSLSGAQRTAVDRVLAGTTGSGPGKSVRGLPSVFAQPIVDEILTRYKAPIGALPIPVVVSTTTANGTAAAFASPVDANGGFTGPAVRCNVRITPLGQSLPSDELTLVLAHELFHCYEAVWLGSVGAYTADPPWSSEGAADWASFNSAGPDPTPVVNTWPEYLTTPKAQLFGRAYDAVGFFGQVAQHGVDLWPLFPKLFTPGSNVARYHVIADAGGDGFLDAWGSGYFRAPKRGDAWDITGKGVVPEGQAPVPVVSLSVPNNSNVKVTASPFATAQYTMQPAADVARVVVNGHARLADDAGFDSTAVSDLYLCTKPGGDCACPGSGGDANQVPITAQKVDGELTLGLTGATAGASGTIAGMSLKDFCAKKTTTTTGTTGTADTSGQAWCAMVIDVNTRHGTMVNNTYSKSGLRDAAKETAIAQEATKRRAFILSITPPQLLAAQTQELDYFAAFLQNPATTPPSNFLAGQQVLIDYQKSVCGISFSGP